jgi:SagB-type dehydrogenase family enzyme
MVLSAAMGATSIVPFIGAPRCEEAKVVSLPQPRSDSGVSVEKTLLGRRSIRTFSNKPLTLGEVSQLLWAAQGITGKRGDRELRTAPSAGALYGLETYLAAANVTGLAPGVYRYSPQGHTLTLLMTGDPREVLSKAAFNQSCIGEGAALIIFAGVYERVTKKYVERGIRFVHMEAGHAAQNVYLQAEALGLGTVAVGSFTESEVKKLLSLPDGEEPLYMMPVGKKQ